VHAVQIARLAGANRALDQAVSCLGRGGRAVLIGMCMEPVQLSEPSVLFGYYNHALLGHLGYQKRNIDQLVRLVASGWLDLSRSISDVLPLEDVARAWSGSARRKATPSASSSSRSCPWQGKTEPCRLSAAFLHATRGRSAGSGGSGE
jgi:threonine dehydrogenase-like Zn-dependent dehydrogenase